MSSLILSMAQMGGVDLGSSAYSFQMTFQGDNEKEQHNSPHVHVAFNGHTIASLSLDPPFGVIVPKDKHKLKKHMSFIKKAQEHLKANIGYWHFVWDIYSKQFNYAGEWQNNDSLKESYRQKHNRENPSRKF